MSLRKRFSILIIICMALMESEAVFTVQASLAQGESESSEEVVVSDATPDSGGSEVVDETGLLKIVAYTCESSEASILIYPGEEFVPDETCYQDYASVLVDGIDYGPAAPVLEVELTTGVHGVSEVTSGAYFEVELYSDALSVVAVVTTLAASEEPVAPADEPVDTVPLRIVMHQCSADIQNLDAFWARGSVLGRTIDCPTITRPDEYQPDGSVTGGQLWFDFTIVANSGSQYSLADGQFQPDQVCESQTGTVLTNNPYDDGCLGTSGYLIDVPAETLTVSQAAYPDLARFGYAETSSDGTSYLLQTVDQGSGSIILDLSQAGPEGIELHVYDFVPARIDVVVHSCPADVTGGSALQDAGGFLQRRALCPADYRAADGGAVPFDVTLTDGYGSVLPNAVAGLGTTLACEFDMGIEFTEPADDNACFEDAAYTFFDVGVGYSVISIDPGGGRALAVVETVPGSGDDGVLGPVDVTAGTVAFDTTTDGEVTLHLYTIQLAQPTAVPPTPTATATTRPTNTPTPKPSPTPNLPGPATTGAVQVVALFCLGDRNATTITALSPGAVAGAEALGGSCFAGDTGVTLSLGNGTVMGPVRLGSDGIETFTSVPSSQETGNHVISEQLTGSSAPLEVTSGTVTRIIIRFEVALSGGDAVGSAPSTSGTSGGTASGSSNPLDQLNGLVTDELGGVANDGISFGSASDPNFYVVDLLGDLEADEVTAISSAESLPGVGTGSSVHRARSASWLVMVVSLMALGLIINRRSQLVRLRARTLYRTHR